MNSSVFDHPYLDTLFGDAEIAVHLSADAELAAMVRFEIALARVEARLGVIPAGAGDAIAKHLDGFQIDPPSLAASTRSAGVVVPGLVECLRIHVGPPHGGYIHWGATSQDVVDTGFVLRLIPILKLLEARLRSAVLALCDQAERHAALPVAGRTRSQIATPVTLGLRIAGWLNPLIRCIERLEQLRPRLLVLQFGGASGALTALGDNGIAVMQALADDLGLRCPAKPWHVERDSFVELANWLTLVSGLIGRIGSDLILMGRSEIGEARAGTGGGSSTMPQKVNPVTAEMLVALARCAIAHGGLAQQTLLSVEERDGTTWFNEWMAFPSLLTATAAALRELEGVAATLEATPGRMRENLALGGGVAKAENFAFALAQQIPLNEAQSIVKQAANAVSTQGGDLATHVTALCAERGLEPPLLETQTSLATATALVERTVAHARTVL